MKAANDFKAFILRGNVVDLAVGIIIGAAFGTVVTAFVKQTETEDGLHISVTSLAEPVALSREERGLRGCL